MSGRVRITVDDIEIEALAGASVAAVLANARHPSRRSVGGAPRAALCGMGICHECRVTIDGRAHQRGCMVIVAPGMVVTRDG